MSIDACNKIIIVGVGKAAEKVVKHIYECGKANSIVAILDNNICNIGGSFCGKTIDHEKNISKYIDSNTTIIIASQYFNFIYERIEKYCNKIESCLVPNFFCCDNIFQDDEKIISFNDEKYELLYNLLDDKKSKKLLEMIINYRGKEIKYESYMSLKEFAGFEDYWISVKPSRKNNSSVIIDGGAYEGDSIELLYNNIGGEIDNYYAFEPDTESFKLLKHKAESFQFFKRVTLIEKGLWDENKTLKFDISEENKKTATFKESNVSGLSVQVQSLDSMIFEENVDIFIKMDIEGSEFRALKGAENLIKTRKPSLAICVYHKANDIVNIPLYLKQLVPEYSIYLCGGNHTICIAQVE